MGRVKYNQKGYVGYSMSRRAVIAYKKGQKPRTKWTKTAMVHAIEDYCSKANILYDGSAALMSKAQLFQSFFMWKSWHHTGSHARRTEFYGLNKKAVEKVYGKGLPPERKGGFTMKLC